MSWDMGFSNFPVDLLNKRKEVIKSESPFLSHVHRCHRATRFCPINLGGSQALFSVCFHRKYLDQLGLPRLVRH